MPLSSTTFSAQFDWLIRPYPAAGDYRAALARGRGPGARSGHGRSAPPGWSERRPYVRLMPASPAPGTSAPRRSRPACHARRAAPGRLRGIGASRPCRGSATGSRSVPAGRRCRAGRPRRGRRPVHYRVVARSPAMPPSAAQKIPTASYAAGRSPDRAAAVMASGPSSAGTRASSAHSRTVPGANAIWPASPGITSQNEAMRSCCRP